MNNRYSGLCVVFYFQIIYLQLSLFITYLYFRSFINEIDVQLKLWKVFKIIKSFNLEINFSSSPITSVFIFIKKAINRNYKLKLFTVLFYIFVLDVSNIMCVAAGRRIFREFLRCEYSEENILFWEACEDLKKETNSNVIEERARFIYEDFISILSPKEVK